MPRLPQPFIPAAWDMPTEARRSELEADASLGLTGLQAASPVGIHAFKRLTVWAVAGGYQANLAADEANTWVCETRANAIDAITACFKSRFG